MADPVRIVLVDTSHPGNLGAAARAMKNMGLSDLALVRPQCFPHAEATARAAGAADLLAAARVHDTVPAAVADCVRVLASSARPRAANWRVLAPRAAAAELRAAATAGPVALLFGGERSGLSNEDLCCAQALVCIPTSADYASLNLAQAVQLLCYELHLAAGEAPPPVPGEPATAAELAHLYDHLERVMRDTGFLHAGNDAHLRGRLERLLARALPERKEVQILRGFLTAVEARRRGPP